MKAYEQLKELLQEEVEKIAKKGDITPGELESVYKAIKTLKGLEEISMMESGGEYSQRGGNSRDGSSRDGSSNRGGNTSYGNSYRNSYENYRRSYDGGSYEGGSYDGRSYDGRSYDGSYDGNSRDGGSNDYSEENSYRRRRDSRGRYSRAGSKDEMLAELSMMLQMAKNDNERRAIRQCMEQLEM